MKKLICTLCFICFYSFGYSQLHSYKLDSYTQPDFYRKISSLSPSASINKLNEERVGNEITNVLNSNVSLNYNLSIYQYNQNTQSTLFINQNPLYTYSKNVDIKDKSIQYNSSIFYLKKHFINGQKLFIAYDLDHSGWVNKSSRDVPNPFSFFNDYTRLSKNTFNNILFKIGKGRIENVDVAFHALQILNRICNHSSIQSDKVSHEQIIALADKLGALKNLRNPDFRLEDNQKIDSLLTYLENQQLVQKDDYYLIAEVLDAFRFESFVIRNKGCVWHFGIGGQQFYSISEYDILSPNGTIQNEQNYINSQYGPFVEAGFTYYKPISHKWQLDNVNLLQAGEYNTLDYVDFGEPSDPARDKKVTTKWLQLRANISFTCILNRRTNLFLRFNNSIAYQRRTEIDIPFKSISHSNNSSLGLTYYFSPWHTMDFNLGFTYIKGHLQNDQRYVRTTTRIGTNYYFN